MAETTMVSERDAVMREREAYKNGMIRGSAREFQKIGLIEDAAREAFPLPKVAVPRVVADPHASAAQWRLLPRPDGMKPRIEMRWPGEDWKAYPREGESMFPTARRVAVWSELFANPTELVDAPAAASPEGR